MTGLEYKVLGGVATLLAVLVVGAVFGRLHGTNYGQIGDRVACGLFALPLIILAVHLAFPGACVLWLVLAPLPLAGYVALLAGTDKRMRISKNLSAISRKRFTFALIAWCLFIYAGMIVLALVVWLLKR